MRHVTSRIPALVAAIALLSSCAPNDFVAVERQLLDGVAFPVTLVSQTNVPLDGLPRIAITGLVGEVEVVWDTETAPCLTTHASGMQQNAVLEIQISRSPDSLMSCIATRVGNRYILHAGMLTAGTYEVRVLDQEFGAPLREVGRKTVVVSNPRMFD